MRLRSNFLQNIWHLDILPYLPLVPTNKASATFDKCNFFLCAAVPLQNYRGTTHICSSGPSEPRGGGAVAPYYHPTPLLQILSDQGGGGPSIRDRVLCSGMLLYLHHRNF